MTLHYLVKYALEVLKINKGDNGARKLKEKRKMIESSHIANMANLRAK